MQQLFAGDLVNGLQSELAACRNLLNSGDTEAYDRNARIEVLQDDYAKLLDEHTKYVTKAQLEIKYLKELQNSTSLQLNQAMSKPKVTRKKKVE